MDKIKDLTRPIIGLQNRTPLEVFDIMADRITRSILNSPDEAAVERAARGIQLARNEILRRQFGDAGVFPWDELTDEGRDDLRAEARAALTAALGVAAPDGGRS